MEKKKVTLFYHAYITQVQLYAGLLLLISLEMGFSLTQDSIFHCKHRVLTKQHQSIMTYLQAE